MMMEIIEAEETALIKQDDLNAMELFTPDGMDNILTQIKEKIDGHVSDISTAAGRKDVASFAYRIARSKTIIDGIGKKHTAAEKARLKLVDTQRKRSRDTLTEWQVKVRRPLTEWEAAEKAKEDAKRLEAEKEIDEEDAYEHEALLERECVVAAKEAEIARKAEEQRQLDREALIAKAAAEKATREAEETIAREKAAREKAERANIEAEALAKAEKEAAVREAERKAKAEAEYKEAERLAAEQAEKANKEKRAANKRHRQVVEGKAVAALADLLVEYEFEADAQDIAGHIITWIEEGQVPNVTINY